MYVTRTSLELRKGNAQQGRLRRSATRRPDSEEGAAMRQRRNARTAAALLVAAAIMACGGTVQAQSALFVQATLDVSVVSRAGTVMTVPMRVWNSGPATAQNVKVTVIGPSGTPPAPLLGPSLPIVVGTLGPCPSPCADR